MSRPAKSTSMADMVGGMLGRSNNSNELRRERERNVFRVDSNFLAQLDVENGKVCQGEEQ